MLIMIFRLSQSDRSNIWGNIASTIFLGALGYFFLSPITKSRQRAEEGRQHLRDLIREMGSRVNDIAIHAVEELRRLEALTDGTLNGERFCEANLRGADLRRAVLRADFTSAHLEDALLGEAQFEDACLAFAYLQGAKMKVANLKRANLDGTNLEGAYLPHANLEETSLGGACLKKANLYFARLGGANLTMASLEGANLIGVSYNRRTILPNGSHWTPGTDMSRFTNP